MAWAEQLIWNTVHGKIFISSIGDALYSYFCVIRLGINCELPSEISTYIFSGVHILPIIIFISPFYAVFQYAETLLIAQSIVLASGAIPIYFIALKELNNKFLALAISISYLLAPSLQAANIIDFNYLAFAVPLLFGAFYFQRTNRWVLYWVCVGLSFFVRQDVAIATTFLGLYLMFFEKKWKQGSLTTIVSVVWLCIALFIIYPNFMNPFYVDDPFTSISGGEGIKGITKNLFSNPDVIFEHVQKTEPSYYLFQIFSHTAFLSFYSPSQLLISIGTILTNILSDKFTFRIMLYHYQLLALPGIYFATIFSMKKIIDKFQSNKKQVIIILSTLILVSALASNIFFSSAPLFSLGFINTEDGIKIEKRWVWWEFLNPACCWDYSIQNPRFFYYQDQYSSINKALVMIPPDSSVSAQEVFTSKLSKRTNLYAFPIFYNNTEYVIAVDDPQGMLSFSPIPAEVQTKVLQNLENSSVHEILLDENGVILFKKKSDVFYQGNK